MITPNYREKKGLTLKPGHVCIYKGVNDKILMNSEYVIVYSKGSEKRCGGQGDILSGVLATALSLDCEDIMESCRSACELTRSASALAFSIKGYGLITGDVIDAIPGALGLLFKDFTDYSFLILSISESSILLCTATRYISSQWKMGSSYDFYKKLEYNLQINIPFYSGPTF